VLPDVVHAGQVNTDEAFVQVARLGLKGDSASIGRYLRRFLRDAAKDKNIAQSTKQALAELIADQPSSTMRFIDPTETESIPFLSIEQDVASEEPLLAPAVTREFDAIVSEHGRVEALATVGLSRPARCC